MPNVHLHHMNTGHNICDTLDFLAKNFDRQTVVDISKIITATRSMLYEGERWPSYTDAAKEYTCLVHPEKMIYVMWQRAFLVCMIDYLAHHAATLSKRMEEIGLGHMEPNKMRWVKAAFEHCKIDLPKPHLPEKPKPEPVDPCVGVEIPPCNCHEKHI